MEIGKLDGDLEILVEYSDEPTVTLRGEVDFRNMDRVKAAICGLVERGKASINVDLKELVFMDSTGVSALVDAARAVLPHGGHVKLVSPTSQLVKVLSRSGFSDVFRFGASRAAGPNGGCGAATAAGGDVLEFEVPDRAEMIAHIRARVAEFAASMPFCRDEIDDIKLAVGEASANALRHGANPDWRRVGVRVARLHDGISVRVRDRGRGFDPDHVCPPGDGELCEGGRGIMFMRALMDEVKFHFGSPGTEVELIKRLNGGRA